MKSCAGGVAAAHQRKGAGATPPPERDLATRNSVVRIGRSRRSILTMFVALLLLLQRQLMN